MVQLGGVGVGVAASAQAGGNAVEGWDVQPGQAAHGHTEVNSFNGGVLAGPCRALEWWIWRDQLKFVGHSQGGSENGLFDLWRCG